MLGAVSCSSSMSLSDICPLRLSAAWSTSLLAARLAARYSQGRDGAEVEVEVARAGEAPHIVTVQPYPVDAIPAEWHV